MTEKELLHAAAKMDMPDFDAVKQKCLAGEKKKSGAGYAYKKQLAAAACLAVILLALPVTAMLGNKNSDIVAADQQPAVASENPRLIPENPAQMPKVDTYTAENEENQKVAVPNTKETATSEGKDTVGQVLRSETDTAGDEGSTAAQDDTAVAPPEPTAVITADSFNVVDAAPAVSVVAVMSADCKVMTADEAAEYYGAPLSPTRAPEGYEEQESGYAIYENAEQPYFDTGKRVYAADTATLTFLMSKANALFTESENCIETNVDGVGVALFAYGAAYAAYYTVGDVHYGIVGENVNMDEFVTVLMTQINKE